jgi:hypothetical protein
MTKDESIYRSQLGATMSLSEERHRRAAGAAVLVGASTVPADCRNRVAE